MFAAIDVLDIFAFGVFAVLLVAALALLAGLGGARCGRAVLFVLPATWLAGAAPCRLTNLSAGQPVLSPALLVVVGVLVAVD
jgi:hypothetical protein